MPAWLSHHLSERRAPRRSQATPRARGWPAATSGSPAIASERAASEFGLHIVAQAIQDDAHNRTRFAILAHPRRSRSHRPRATTAPAWSSRYQPARRGPRHAGAAEEARRVDDALRIAAGALGAVGVLLLHRRRGPPGRSPRVAAALASCARSVPSSRCWAPTRRRALNNGSDVPSARRHRLRPDGRLVRARPQARRPGQARRRLQQVALDDRAGAPARRHRRRRAESALLAVSGSDIVLIAVPVAATEATFKAIRHLVDRACW